MKAKSVILADLGLFRGFGPLLGPWGRNESFSENFFLQCTTRYGNTTSDKISEKSNRWLSGNSPDGRTDERTGLITIVPFRLKSGTNTAH